MRVALVSEQDVAPTEVLLENRDTECGPEEVALAWCEEILLIPGEAYYRVGEWYALFGQCVQLSEASGDGCWCEPSRSVVPATRKDAYRSGGLKTGNQNRRSGGGVQRVNEGRARLAEAES